MNFVDLVQIVQLAELEDTRKKAASALSRDIKEGKERGRWLLGEARSTRELRSEIRSSKRPVVKTHLSSLLLFFGYQTHRTGRETFQELASVTKAFSATFKAHFLAPEGR